jgi:hypothetical protein
MSKRKWDDLHQRWYEYDGHDDDSDDNDDDDEDDDDDDEDDDDDDDDEYTVEEREEAQRFLDEQAKEKNKRARAEIIEKYNQDKWLERLPIALETNEYDVYDEDFWRVASTKDGDILEKTQVIALMTDEQLQSTLLKIEQNLKWLDGLSMRQRGNMRYNHAVKYLGKYTKDVEDEIINRINNNAKSARKKK